MNDGSRSYDAIVLGGGAAGMMCAIEAGKRGRRVALLEQQERIGKKIGISGGGRCNFTNLGASAENYLSDQPDFCKSALARYTPWDFLALVEKHRIPYHEKKLGQQFCDGSSREIIEMLLAECAAAQVEVITSCVVSTVSKPDGFQLESNCGRLGCTSLVVATGGLSLPKLGATDFGYRIARLFGLRVTELRPGLVPLTFRPEDQKLHNLSGLSAPVVARSNGQAFAENLLFTHRGLSGPAILQISSYWRPEADVSFDLLPGRDATEWLDSERARQTDFTAALSRHLPQRFAEAWATRHAPAKPLQHWKSSELREVSARLKSWTLGFSGTEGYPKAEVTLGGVDTRELSSKTMETRKVPRLYFIGEVVDVTGWLGGYNFQWAWASGHAAGQVI